MDDDPILPARAKLEAVAAALRRGEPAPQVVVRDFLWWWYSQRRGSWVVQMIRSDLELAGLDTSPDFEGAYIGSAITFELSAAEKEATPATPEPQLPDDVTAALAWETESASIVAAYADPTYRLGKLEAANRPPTTVTPSATLREAVSRMMASQFSQLPVMTNEREVKGIVSWSTIGTRLALGQAPATVQDVLEPAVEIGADASLFAALQILVQHDYVLVRASDRRIAGILTTSDISLQFQQLSEPFLLLGEIENHLRRVIASRFRSEDYKAVCDPADPDRKPTKAAELTFGEYQRLLEEPERWQRAGLRLDRVVFVALLENIRRIRNDVMHFDPDGIPPEDVRSLREFAQLLSTLQALGVA